METKTELTRLQFLTMSTCGEACWEAREDVCHCSCHGKNHGILRHNGTRPQRNCRVESKRYILAAVILGYNEAKDAERQIAAEYMPGLDWCAYGQYRDESNPPIFTRKASDSQLRWHEVEGIDNPNNQTVMLVWRLPDGERYITKTSTSKFYSPTGEYIPPTYGTVGKETAKEETDPEESLRAMWKAQGVPQEKQDEIIADIEKKASPEYLARMFAPRPEETAQNQYPMVEGEGAPQYCFAMPEKPTQLALL